VHVRHRQGGGHRRQRRRALLPLHQRELASDLHCLKSARRCQSDTRLICVCGMAQEGQGRQDRKLAVARHRRRRGRSEFIVAQNQDGIFCTSDNNFLGTVGANLVGSKYQIWGQVRPHLKSCFFLNPDCVEHLMSKCSWLAGEPSGRAEEPVETASWRCRVRSDRPQNPSGIRCSLPECFLTQSFWFLQVCPHHHHAHREFQKHEGMDPQEPVHAAQDQQFCSGKFR